MQVPSKIDLFFNELLGEKLVEIQQKVYSRISHELEYSVKQTQLNLIHSGRCDICTLKTPCIHSSLSDPGSFPNTKHLQKPSYWQVVRKQPNPPTDLITLEKIEKFRELKINQQIEEVKQSKIDEEKNKIESQANEKKRIKHAAEQKRKLDEYKEEVKEKRRQLRQQLQENSEKKRIEDQKFREYMLAQKQKLTERHGKNQVMRDFYKNNSFS